jgi:hypothetical protein
VSRFAFAALLGLAAAACNRLPTVYPPPAQAAGLADPSVAPLGSMVAMGDSRADAYIVGGFRARSEGSWRWALDHPVLRFYLPDSGAVDFVMDVTVPEQTFAVTGPQTLTVAVNGGELDRFRCHRPGSFSFERPVPEALLRRNQINLVSITPDKVALREGGEKLGFVLSRAGFAE